MSGSKTLTPRFPRLFVCKACAIQPEVQYFRSIIFSKAIHFNIFKSQSLPNRWSSATKVLGIRPPRFPGILFGGCKLHCNSASYFLAIVKSFGNLWYLDKRNSILYKGRLAYLLLLRNHVGRRHFFFFAFLVLFLSVALFTLRQCR